MSLLSSLFHRPDRSRETETESSSQKNSHDKLFAQFSRESQLMATPQQLEANRAQLHDLFSSQTWKGLDYSTRCQAVQALENDFSFQQGRPARPVTPIKLPDGHYGGWSPSKETIFLNKNLLETGSLDSGRYATPLPDANIQIFDTIAHEGYHAYQSYALDHPEVHADKEQLREWALNEGKYYQDGRYNLQPQERDAWKYGYTSTREAFQGIQERNGPEPAWQDYQNMVNSCSYENILSVEQARDPQVLEHMEQEMQTACQQQGIFYDYPGREQAETQVREQADLAHGPAPTQEHTAENETWTTRQEATPQQEEAAQLEQAPQQEETAQLEQAPQQEQTDQLEQTPQQEETAQLEQAPQQEQAAQLEQAPQQEQTPQQEETAQLEQAPQQEQAAQLEQAPQQEEAAQLEQVSQQEQAPETFSMEQMAPAAPQQENTQQPLSMEQMQPPQEQEQNAPAQEQGPSLETLTPEQAEPTQDAEAALSMERLRSETPAEAPAQEEGPSMDSLAPARESEADSGSAGERQEQEQEQQQSYGG